MERNRIIAYDALRVFAIITVVGIHTLMPYRELLPPTAPVRLFDDFLHYAVPLFVFMSGVFVWGRARPTRLAEEWRSAASRAGWLLLPYLAWSALYLGLLTAKGAPPGLGETVGLLLVGNTWYHLYFVPMLATFYLLTPVAARISAKSPVLLVLAAYAVRLLLGPLLVGAAQAAFGDLGWSYMTHVVIHVPHMALGAWFANAWKPNWPVLKWAWPIMLGVGTVILVAISLGASSAWPDLARRAIHPAGMALTVLGLASGALAAEPLLEHSGRARAAIAWTAPLALGVYFIHPALLLGVDAALSGSLSGAATSSGHRLWLTSWFALAVWTSVTTAAFGISSALAAWPVTAWLVGVRGDRQRRRTR